GARATQAFHQCLVQAISRIDGQWRGLRIAEYLDGLLRGIHNHSALLAFSQMLLDFRAKLGVEFLIQIAFEFDYQCLAVH
ncbi:MAG: hypothetical protein WBZ32_03830, partial [Candidatus Acidiferrales bacterium]